MPLCGQVGTSSAHRFLLSTLVGLLLVGMSGCSSDDSKRAVPAPGVATPKPPQLLLPEAETFLSGQALLEALKGGGYLLYFRHFHTDHTKWHEDPIKPKHGEMTVADFRATCDQQRPLTEFGRRRAQDVGAIMREFGIPLGTVLASPYCRVVESAQLLSGRDPDDTPYALVYRGGALTYELMAHNVRPLLGTPPGAGTNTLLVAHRPQMDDMRFIAEGEAFILKPLGEGKFNWVATISDSEWFEALRNVAYLGLRGRQLGMDGSAAR